MITYSDFQEIIDLSGTLKFPDDLTPLTYDLFYEYYLHIGGENDRPKVLADVQKIGKDFGLC